MLTRKNLLLNGLVVVAAGVLLCGQNNSRAATAETNGLRTITLVEFDHLRRDTNYTVLDVRTPREYAAGHVPGALNIDYRSADFAAAVGRLDRQKPYLLHCASGNRSARAASQMSRMGFQRLYDFTGGWAAWKNSPEAVGGPAGSGSGSGKGKPASPKT